MSNGKEAHVGILALCLLVGLASGLAAAPAAAVKVEGRIMLGEGITMLMLNVFQDGAPLAGIRVKVAGRPAEEMGAGKYQLLIHEALGAPGKPLQVTIEPPIVSAQPFETITATAQVAPWVKIAAPANEAHVGAGGPDLVVVWGGGYVPYSVLARPEDQPAEYAFEEYGILAAQKAIPMSHFSKGKRYLLNVGFEAKDFIFAGPVERGSRIVLAERSKPVRINID